MSRRDSARWSPERAERHLRSLELFGMRFGLDRMRRMMTVLGSPQRNFQTIHVVGTNGKTSTTKMIAAILSRHGLRTGAYTSPHLISYAERVQVDGRDVPTHAFAAAIARAAWAAERVNRTLVEDDHVTQFELLTAAALWELAAREVDVAVIEAGLGGRYDATGVIDSSVVVLTSIGLEHTRWLGPTLRDIAGEKLAVLGEGSTLVVPASLPQETMTLARDTAQERRARLLVVGPASGELELAARGVFQRENFALARCAASAFLEQVGVATSEERTLAAGAEAIVPGRLQRIADAPLTLLDGAHNPAAAQALAASLPELLAGRRAGLVLGVLEDKDAAGMLAALLALFERAWFTAPPSSRALSPAALGSLARQLGFERATCEPDPGRAFAAARAWAQERPDERALVATGSIYLVGDLLERERECAERPEALRRGSER
jgi:dihydrofolate synthase / folylpolyglutamate synthase